MSYDLYYNLRKAENLKKAWRRVRENGLKSRNREIALATRNFEDKWETHLKRIQLKLRRGHFKFQPAMGILKERPGKTPRPIVLAHLEDRIVQRAILNIVQSEPKLRLFVENKYSFGGLPSRGVRNAIEVACRRIHGGGSYFIKSDIHDFFTCIPREAALKELCMRLRDRSLDDILDRATTVELANMAALGEGANRFPTYEIGVAQGCCLSPLIGNVVLSGFDNSANTGNVTCLRYIDDLLFLAPTRTS